MSSRLFVVLPFAGLVSLAMQGCFEILDMGDERTRHGSSTTTSSSGSGGSGGTGATGGADAGPICTPDAAVDPCTGTVEWAKNYGDVQNQVGQAIAVDGAGDVLVTGYFPAGSDVFVAKLDPNGNDLWSKEFGDASGAYGKGIAVDGAGDVLVAGYFNGTVNFGSTSATLTSAGGEDIFIAKLDRNGNHVWSKSFGNPQNQVAQAIAVDAEGDALVTGDFSGTINVCGTALIGSTLGNIFVAKLDSHGNCVWAKGFGDGSGAVGQAIAVDAAGDVLVTGQFSGTINFGSTPGTALTSASGEDVFLAKLDPSSNHLWSKSFGAGSGVGVAADGMGNVLLTGSFNGTINFGSSPGTALTSAGGQEIFLAKLDPSGSHLWSKGVGDGSGAVGQSIAADTAGNVLATGAFAGTVDFGGTSATTLTCAGGTDIFVAKLNPGGDYIWSESFGNAQSQVGDGIATDAAGDVLLTGFIEGTVGFGSTTLVSAGGQDIFVAKLAP